MPEISQNLRNRLVLNGYSVASFERLEPLEQILIYLHLNGGKATAAEIAHNTGLDLSAVRRLLAIFSDGWREKMV